MLDLHPKTRPVIDFPLALGECPTWDEASQSLWFIDITAPKLHHLHPVSGKLVSYAMPESIGSFGFCMDHRLVVGLRNGVHYFDPRSQKLTLLVDPEPDNPHTRLNDGKIGPDGCFWVGSMDDRKIREPIAALYRVTPDGQCTKKRDGLRISNGLAWSPDGRKMIHADTMADEAMIYDFDASTGALSHGRSFCRLDEATGRPDGAAMDREGFYWSAGVSASCLNRIAPDGTIERKLHIPMNAPTMPCFGGPDLRTLYVTSLARGGQDGTVLALEVDVPGTVSPRFGAHI
ncbi:MAG: SMP-30/gluconolactonase/LRE family protein [Hyphomicrobiales bacterium]|nr:SMP-30/gluconolactonase/LRE family protein [Hyphomicrobiales bacterium]MDE2114178.1 SMP-30/gluconolactonase/LRE family protein [Hyphomicrobiales bacterium]